MEYQAIVLAAGRGTRLPELTGGRPKCLLPVGPFPLVWYPLQMLEKHGFTETILIVQENQKVEIQQSLEKTPLKIKLDFATIPSDVDFGTADSLKYIHDRIRSDILVVSCDTITTASLFPLLNQFRQHEASLSVLFFKGGAESDTIVPGPKTKHKPERDLIGIHKETERILFHASTSDFEETLTLSGHLLRKSKSVTICSRLVDSHIYVMRKWIVDFLKQSDGFATIKGELLPNIIKKQMSHGMFNNNEFEKPLSMNVNGIYDIFYQSGFQSKITESSLFNDRNLNEQNNADTIRCFASRAPDTSFGIRVNTSIGYCAANQKIFLIWDKLFNNSTLTLPLIASNSQINCTQMSQCAVGDNTTILEKTSIKNCIFGANCLINSKTRITDCVIMGGVIVEEGVVITNSVICNRAVIKSGSIIKNCLIGQQFIVKEKSTVENVHLTNADGFMEIE